MINNTVSLRIGLYIWLDESRRRELLEYLRKNRSTIDEVAFFTSVTHSVLPYATVSEYSKILREIIPQFKALGLRTGINHLTTIGHLDENLENSLNEPWQKITDINGTEAHGSYCPLDERFRSFTHDCYIALAEAEPDFIWIDDDVRMGHHPPAQLSCFCDLCLSRFTEETGENWTRERALKIINNENDATAREVRTKWVAHNRRILDELFALIRTAVNETNPNLVLGFMPTSMIYEGMGFSQWGQTLAGSKGLTVKWRPGGGFYTDNQPLELLRKAHRMGRTAEAIPKVYTDIQYEHENFPYQKLKKSETVFVAETGAAIAAGCTGVALNLMGISPDPFEEYMPYFNRIQNALPFFDHLVSLTGRSSAEGIWVAMTPDIWAACTDSANHQLLNADPIPCLTELAEIGLPPAYSHAGARVHLLSGGAVFSFTRKELEEMLSGAVMIDGSALRHLQELGLSELIGFEVAGVRDHDTIERFTEDPINYPHVGWWRDCRPSFWRTEAFILKPLSDNARILAELIDFRHKVIGPTMGIFENNLGGRIAVLGYYPWTSLQNLAKSTQMKNLCRWLSHDDLAAYISSFHKVALWCRRDTQGKLLIPLINASFDTVADVCLHVREGNQFRLMRLNGKEEDLTTIGDNSPYRVMKLPILEPLEMVLLRDVSEQSLNNLK